MATRNPFDAPEVKSRRGGPSKKPLSRDAIVKEALEELTRGGLAGMSLRRVAAALETGPASLYAYVDDLSELKALVLDRALASVNVRGGAKKGWRERLIALLTSYLRVLSRSPGLAELALSVVAVGPSAMRIIEALLGLLEEAGIARATAGLGVDLLLLYVTGIAAEQSKGLDPGDRKGSIARAIWSVTPDEYPRIFAAREDLLAGGGERFTWAIDVLLKGMRETSRKPIAADRAKPGKKPVAAGHAKSLPGRHRQKPAARGR